MAGRQRPDQVDPRKYRAAQHARKRGILEEADRLMTVLQFLPLLRGPLRGCFRRWRCAARSPTATSIYLANTVPRLRRLLHRLANSRRHMELTSMPKLLPLRALRFMVGLCLATRFRRPVRAQRPCHQHHRRLERRGIHFRLCCDDRPASAGRCPTPARVRSTH